MAESIDALRAGTEPERRNSPECADLAGTAFEQLFRERGLPGEGIWLVSFLDYDLGYIDLEQKTLQPLDNPFGPRLSPMS